MMHPKESVATISDIVDGVNLLNFRQSENQIKDTINNSQRIHGDLDSTKIDMISIVLVKPVTIFTAGNILDLIKKILLSDEDELSEVFAFSG